MEASSNAYQKAWNPSEKVFQQHVIEAATALGWMVYHTYDSRRSQKGYPDLTMVHSGRGRLMFVELKTNKGKLKPEQEVWLAALIGVQPRVEVHVWRPNHWDWILAELSGEER